MSGSGGDERPPDSVFDAGWLSLREALDHRSRADELLDPLVQEWLTRGWGRIVDLGSGTGSNVRYLAPRLPQPQSWVLVDHDAALLAGAVLPPEAGTPVRMTGDLAREGLVALRDADLCVAAALLDLVSEGWLERVVEGCVDGARGVLFTTTYDGTIAWAAGGSSHPDDPFVTELVNDHQTRDKGLGTALGPRAAFEARARFERVGYRTWLVPSPWRLGPGERAVAERLIDGWEGAAVEQAPDQEARIRDWGASKRRTVREGSFALTVGHLDL
ncbi:MAG: class I SAM-dependent methyltransferase, partial [Gemmatimonadota bacterium]